MENKYNPQVIEKKWQEYWEKNKTFETPKKVSSANKFYILPQLPYPSGSGLHVGHAEVYTACDIYARFQRMKEKKVLQVIGWDSFGLPAENYAIKTNVHPRISTDKAIDNFRSQIKSLGISVDWDREVGAHNSNYYKWTQWFFLLMYKRGLAYRKKQAVNWCEGCKTVLANEQVVDGKCERCETEVVQKEMEQWYLKITDYADQLLRGLDDLDWPEETKKRQKDWIGRSEGAEVDFSVRKKPSKILVLHGITGHNKENWFPWLEKKCKDLNIEYFCPNLPNSDEPSLEEWLSDLESIVKNLDENSIIIGHSLGTTTALHLLEKLNKKICKLILVAPTSEQMGLDEFRKKYQNEEYFSKETIDCIDDFISRKVNFSKILSNVGSVVSYFSENDPFIDFQSREFFKKNLSSKIISFKDRYHFNESFGITEFPELIDEIFLDEKIKVFTTRADTLFGATFMVLAPESKILQKMKSQIENWVEVEKYIEKTKLKTELDRQIEKEKTGVELKGIKAINPVNNEEIPVFTADYVLAGYGTGAIMAVPAHDERDFDFAKKFGLKITQVVAPLFIGQGKDKPKENVEFIKRNSVSVIIKHPLEEKYIVLDWKNNLNWKSFVIGGIEEGEEIKEAAIREMKEETGFVDIKNIYELNALNYNKFYASHKNVNRETIHFPVLVELASLKKVKTDEEETKNHEFIWVEKDELKNILNLENQKFMAQMFLHEQAFTETEGGFCVNSDFLNDLNIKDAQEKIIEFLEEKGLGKRKIQYKLRDWSVSRQRFWGAPIPMLVNEKLKNKKYNYLFIHGFTSTGLGNFRKWLKQELENRGHQVTALDLPNTKKPNVLEQTKYVLDNFNCDENTIIVAHSLGGPVTYRLLEKINKKVAKVVLVDPVVAPEFVDRERSAVDTSGSFKFNFEEVKNKCDDFVIIGEKEPTVIFRKDLEYLRNILDARLVLANPTIDHFCAEIEPVILEECLLLGLKSIPEKDLPVILPDDVDFKPTGESPLNYSKTFNAQVEEKYGQDWKHEPDTLDTFMCSSWYYYRYLDPHNDKEFASAEMLKKWMPVDFYLGGPEHVNGHLLYARFFTKVLFEAGYIDFDEPFKVNRHQGLILGPDSRKMSKRWGNVINPTDVVNEYGADTLRVYEMFMGPLEADKPWDTNGVKGVKRFLEKVWNLQEKISKKFSSEETDKIIHKTLKKVGEDLEKMQFNTAIAKMMELVNFLQKQEKISVENFELFILMLSPLAPHLTEELWQKLGHKNTLSFENWPLFDPTKIIENKILIAIQINGKVRTNIEINSDANESEIEKKALADENVKKWIEGKEIKKIIYIKDKLLSIVV